MPPQARTTQLLQDRGGGSGGGGGGGGEVEGAGLEKKFENLLLQSAH